MNQEQQQFITYIKENLHSFESWLRSLGNVSGEFLGWCAMGLVFLMIIAPVIFLWRDKGNE